MGLKNNGNETGWGVNRFDIATPSSSDLSISLMEESRTKTFIIDENCWKKVSREWSGQGERTVPHGASKKHWFKTPQVGILRQNQV